MDILQWRVYLFSFFVWVVLAEHDDNNNRTVTHRAGGVGQSVKLPCPVKRSNPPAVVWTDTVHTSTGNPIVIYQSENNSDFRVHDGHPNRANYEVDRKNFELKILRLTFDDVGQYNCSSRINAETKTKQYYLVIYDALNCSGETQLYEGQTTSLRCQVAYSGTHPSLHWFRSDLEIESVDHSGFEEYHPVAAKEVVLNASHSDDGHTYRCQLKFLDKSDDCRLVLNVTYPVRDIAIATSSKNKAHVGEEVTCTAKGNPEPEVTLTAVSLSERAADDRKKSHIVIPTSWEWTNVTVECVATNFYQGRVRTIRKKLTFRVTPTPPPTTTTTTTTTPMPTTQKTDDTNLREASRSTNSKSGKLFICWTSIFASAVLVLLFSRTFTTVS